ncbi:ParB N-terminal domain-containing protein [Nodularia harveyana UHCC-0300]|uniref:ParB N-terminal domain-containing protein n=1 Tax=Nodularia harveyana UHCC-0300 TaxID=2974287 RepID=A0ABU5UAY8_9CYAN|nr:ParB N-terminal domain-containing protein [Nodularia harveyana]MEA5580677.1 ParB N-terminal domain-containing protein [Nodularia harveyana UHCC-0300]
MAIVSIDQIRIGLNRRPVKGEKVKELQESIRTNGLLNPITVDKKLNLIAGLHRLTACKLLGLEAIECHIVNYENSDQSRLAEIDENLIRNELEPLERSELWWERDQILERMGVRAKVGDNQYTGKGGETVSPPLKRTLELAKEVGYSERTFQHGKQIAKSIHAEVKEIIKGSPIAESPTALLKIARAGSKERLLAEESERNWELAQARGDEAELPRLAELGLSARKKQKELQILAYNSVMAQREAKLALKKGQRQPEVSVASDELGVRVGEEWMLGRHLVYCDHTASSEFRNLLPSDAALAIATLSEKWEHNYLIDEARVVAVIRSQGHIYDFYRHSQMPFQYELILGNLYVGIFSHQSISQPQTPINIDGVEGIVNYLINLYTHPNNFVIAPFMGNGEILIACERMGRICFIGDENPQFVNRGIMRWQQWTGKLPQNIGLVS